MIRKLVRLALVALSQAPEDSRCFFYVIQVKGDGTEDRRNFAEDMLLRDLPVRQNLCRRSLVFHRLTHEPENPLRLEKRRFLE